MSTETLPRPVPSDTGDDVVHWFCCDPDRAYCGTDLRGLVEVADSGESKVCPLCWLSWEQGGSCKECGR